MSTFASQVFFSNHREQNTTSSEDWTTVYIAVRWIQMVMAVLSIIGAGSIIIYATPKRLIWHPEIQPLFLLSVTDLLLALSWLVGAVLFTQECNNQATCYNLHTIEQMLYMASFFYTLNYIWVLFTEIRTFHCCINGAPAEFPTKVRTFCKMAPFLSCVFPVLFMTPVFITGNMEHCYTNFSQPYKCLLLHTGALYQSPEHRGHGGACSLTRTLSVILFLTAFLFTFVGIVVLMGKSRHIYRRCFTSRGFLGGRQWASLGLVDRRMLLYPSVFLFCWGPAVLLAVMRLCHPEAVEGLVGVVLYIIQALCSGSQGLLNCLVYGWTKRTFRSVGKATLRDADTQTPLLQSQKKGYQTNLCTT